VCSVHWSEKLKPSGSNSVAWHRFSRVDLRTPSAPASGTMPLVNSKKRSKMLVSIPKNEPSQKRNSKPPASARSPAKTDRLSSHPHQRRPQMDRLDMEQLRDALSCSLELLEAEPSNPFLRPMAPCPIRLSEPRYPPWSRPTWSDTLDTLRVPPDDGKHNFLWRKESPIRPSCSRRPRALTTTSSNSIFRTASSSVCWAGSWPRIHSLRSLRACLAQSADAIPRVVLIGRLSLYGAGRPDCTMKSSPSPPAGSIRHPPGQLSPYAREPNRKPWNFSRNP